MFNSIIFPTLDKILKKISEIVKELTGDGFEVLSGNLFYVDPDPIYINTCI